MPFHQGLCELLMVPPGQDMRMGKEGTGVSDKFEKNRAPVRSVLNILMTIALPCGASG